MMLEAAIARDIKNNKHNRAVDAKNMVQGWSANALRWRDSLSAGTLSPQNIERLVCDRLGPDAERLYAVYYSQGPRLCFVEAAKKYHLSKKIICDVGCGCGVNLFHCQPESYGIEINKNKVEWGQKLGLNVFNRNVGEDDLSDLPKAGVIWCGGVIEHVDNLHRFLVGLNELLITGGQLFIHASIVPSVPILQLLGGKLGAYMGGWYAPTMHCNAFTRKTLQYVCEAAGFETFEMSPFYPKPFSVMNKIPILRTMMGKVTWVGRKNNKKRATKSFQTR